MVDFSQVGEDAWKLAATAAGSAVAAVLGAQRALKTWTTVDKDISADRSENQIIGQLRDEVHRLFDQNQMIAAKLNELQNMFFTVRSENADMRIRIKHLEVELAEFRSGDQR